MLICKQQFIKISHYFKQPKSGKICSLGLAKIMIGKYRSVTPTQEINFVLCHLQQIILTFVSPPLWYTMILTTVAAIHIRVHVHSHINILITKQYETRITPITVTQYPVHIIQVKIDRLSYITIHNVCTI